MALSARDTNPARLEQLKKDLQADFENLMTKTTPEEFRAKVEKITKNPVDKPRDYDMLQEWIRSKVKQEERAAIQVAVNILNAQQRIGSYFELPSFSFFVQACIPNDADKNSIVTELSSATNNKELARQASRWTPQDTELARDFYLKRIQDKWLPKRIYQVIADSFGRSFLSVKQKIEKLREVDPELLQYKYKHWARESIIQELESLYLENEDMNRADLPTPLRSQITNHSYPKCKNSNFKCWFSSFDDTVAEAIYNVGAIRNEDGEFENKPFLNIADAKTYYERSFKKTHRWTKEQIAEIIQEAHKKHLPVTRHFFAKYPMIYRQTLGLNRSLEGFKSHVNKFFNTWGEMLQELDIAGKGFYNDWGNLTMSSEEAYVAGFMDQHNIRYRRCDNKDKIPVADIAIAELGYSNFVPDFFLLDEEDEIVGVIEVFGSIADMPFSKDEDTPTTGELYREKRSQKILYFTEMFGEKFIAIDANAVINDLPRLDKKLELWIR